MRHFKSIDVRKKLLHPILVTEEKKTWYITKDGIPETPVSNHAEADKRIIMEAVKSDGPVIVKAADTDILVLMRYAHSRERKANQCIMRINEEIFVSFNLIVKHLGQRFEIHCQHTIVSLVVIQYPANVGKVKPLKKMIKLGEEDLLADFGGSCSKETVLKEAMTFFQTIMCAGKEKETITQARCRVYLKQKRKSNTNLIPDKDSIM